mgnify:CR=1 FL=1
MYLKSVKMKLIFFKRPKVRQFNYKPRYYDQAKEEREERKKRLGITDSEDPTDQLRARIRRNWRYETEAKRKRTSELRTIVYLSIAAFFVYLILFTDMVQNFVRVFLK